MIIASQHQWKDKEYQPSCAWPEKCYVQWGKSGVVISRKGSSYLTAFFEAFPGDNSGGFIRGEGKSIAEAEADAFAKYTKEVACDHRWGRKGYTNGGAICYKCKAFKSVFKPIHVFGDWRKPITKDEQWILDLPPMEKGDQDYERRQAYRHKLALRKKVFGGQDETIKA